FGSWFAEQAVDPVPDQVRCRARGTADDNGHRTCGLPLQDGDAEALAYRRQHHDACRFQVPEDPRRVEAASEPDAVAQSQACRQSLEGRAFWSFADNQAGDAGPIPTEPCDGMEEQVHAFLVD